MKPVFIILLAFNLTGCEKQPEQDTSGFSQRIQQLESEISDLKSNQLAARDVNFYLWQSDTNHDQRIQALESADMLRDQKWVMLDPTTKAYQRIDTSIGSLLVSVKSVTPYLDGFNVTIAIGNPYGMDLNGILVSCKWGTSFLYTNGIVSNYQEVQNSQKSKDFQQTDVLLGGRWNPVELAITPATADEIKNLRISITPDTVSLYNKSDTQP
jgi:hypothetical protein